MGVGKGLISSSRVLGWVCVLLRLHGRVLCGLQRWLDSWPPGADGAVTCHEVGHSSLVSLDTAEM